MDNKLELFWLKLQRLTKDVQSIADDITVIFVANRQKGVSNSLQDRSTEYFTDYESNQILTSLRLGGFRTKYFEGEAEFIRYALERYEDSKSPQKKIIYNTSQSGTDPARKSMIPAFCSLYNLPTCNSNSYVVSLARHKLHVHAILRKYGLPTPDTWAFDPREGWLFGCKPDKEICVIAKAGHESASIGLDNASVGHLNSEYEAILIKRCNELKQQFIVQKFISGYEFEVPVINFASERKALSPVLITVDSSIKLGNKILSYNIVAHDDYKFNKYPSIFEKEALKMQKVARDVCSVLGISGFARVDFRLDENKNIWVTDVSTSPHIVKHSSYWFSFKSKGWSHEDMLSCMIGVKATDIGWVKN